jgi:hypothetical protein
VKEMFVWEKVFLSGMIKEEVRGATGADSFLWVLFEC